MEYVNLGGAACEFAPVPRMMSFGKHESRDWALDEPLPSRSFADAQSRAGSSSSTPSSVYNDSRRSCSARPSQALRHSRGVRRGDPGSRHIDARRERSRPFQGPSWPRSTASLQRLELDYVDLYQIHRWDETTPIEETMVALRRRQVRRRRATSVRAACTPGSSRRRRGRAEPFRLVQSHYNLIYRKRSASDSAVPRPGVGVAWSRSPATSSRAPHCLGERLTPAPPPIPFWTRSTGPSSTSRSSTDVAEVAAELGDVRRASRARLAPPQARGDGTDRRRDDGPRRGRSPPSRFRSSTS